VDVSALAQVSMTRRETKQHQRTKNDRMLKENAMFSKEHSSFWMDSSNGAHDDQEGPHLHLTPREREVLALLCEGLPNKLICRRLNIASGTVKIHIGRILRQFGASNRLQAVVSAYRQGLLQDCV
jgi:DNA-binding CsgD family transcriptional regulator